ncbi:hypothetical protein CLV51_105232 [Chitinophaga niastensis]|uniref:Uncharacterized protein n=1 Tax=Chitinophaga niastensis TaxID=536980 RepID=A0A2P8HF61_CHINA|nr:hypothetical protein [Chitinophaga niastensis]PSL44859.1 hypothetical protein CLV51_105232 [Chitinophaga niastensis]
MHKNLLPFYWLLGLIIACDAPVVVDKANITHIEKIERETDVLPQTLKKEGSDNALTGNRVEEKIVLSILSFNGSPITKYFLYR